MPKISIIVSDDTYCRLSGSDESISNIVQKAPQYYWKKTTHKKKITNTIILLLPMEKTKTEIPELCNKLSKEYIAGW